MDSIGQLNIWGLSKTEVSIMRLQEFEPPEGYYLALSGGKDSDTVYDLVQKAGVKYDAHYHKTGIDPPEVVYHIREKYPDIIVESPEKSLWKWIEKKGLPTRKRRWCCEKLKECYGKDRFIVTGVRWAESSRRRARSFTEICTKDPSKRFLHPIIEWAEAEVWQYIRDNNIDYCKLYDRGFKRLGCVLCPLATAKNTKIEMQTWPKMANLWRVASIKKYGDDKVFLKWIQKLGDAHPDQCNMFA